LDIVAAIADVEGLSESCTTMPGWFGLFAMLWRLFDLVTVPVEGFTGRVSRPVQGLLHSGQTFSLFRQANKQDLWNLWLHAVSNTSSIGLKDLLHSLQVLLLPSLLCLTDISKIISLTCTKFKVNGLLFPNLTLCFLILFFFEYIVYSLSYLSGLCELDVRICSQAPF